MKRNNKRSRPNQKSRKKKYKREVSEYNVAALREYVQRLRDSEDYSRWYDEHYNNGLRGSPMSQEMIEFNRSIGAFGPDQPRKKTIKERADDIMNSDHTPFEKAVKLSALEMQADSIVLDEIAKPERILYVSAEQFKALQEGEG